MKTKVLFVVWFVAALALLLVFFSAPGEGRSSPSQLADETFVDRAVRTRLNADARRDVANASNETVLERAIRTRASELIERAESKP